MCGPEKWHSAAVDLVFAGKVSRAWTAPVDEQGSEGLPWSPPKVWRHGKGREEPALDRRRRVALRHLADVERFPLGIQPLLKGDDLFHPEPARHFHL